VRDIYLGM